jgi:hypothetical protein
MPAAFAVANSPLTSNGTIAVTGAGTVAQYVRGDGTLADFPESSGGGSSVSYYLNGSVSQGTIGGVAYLEMNKVPILGAGTDFTRNSNGYIASFITDAGDPNLLEIPGGNWNFESYFSASSGGGSPTFYVELYKVNAGGTATLIASNSANPELISFGTTIAPYFSSLAVPTTTLALTDRLAVRYYVTPAGRTLTLHTEGPHLCQIITTFTTGLTALNGLTTQVQFFAVGTSGTDFNIASATATHTFNLPTASATNRGALSSTDWALFTQAYNDKINSASVTGTTTKTLTLTQQDGGTITASWTDLNTDAVISVFGRTGAVVAANGDYTTAQVTESGNLYYTEARVNANTNVAANTAARHNAVTLGTANGLSLSTQVLSLGLASAGVTGALSGSDWSTFNGKANANGSNASGTWGINITGNSTSVINTVTGTNSVELVRGNMGDNDQFRILVGASASNAGYVEIATADDGTEPIFVRQYTGIFSSLVRNATLLDGSGNTSFPGSITGNSIIKSGGTSSQYLMADGSVSTLSNLVTGTGSAGQVAYWSSGSAITGESNLFWDATNDRLGVGVNNPQSRLHINGTLTFTESGFNTVRLHQIVSSHSDGSSINNRLAFFISDGVGSTAERMRINGAGNLLIGTVSDNGVRLQVNGGINVAGTSALADNQLRIRTIDDPNHAIVHNETINGPLSYGFFGSGLGWTEGGAAQIALMTRRGNVGIGTNTPTAIGNYKSLTLDGTDGSIIDFRFAGSGNGRIYSSNDTALGIESLSTTLPLVFKTQNGSGSLERMRITPAGNVGIGTVSPTLVNFGLEFVVSRITGAQQEAQLVIQGNTTTNSNVGGLHFYNNTNFLANISGAREGANNSGIIKFSTNNAGSSAERMRITSNGNVGIGTTTVLNNIGAGTLQLGTTMNLLNIGNQAYMQNNWNYVGAGTPTHIITGPSSRFLLNTSGDFIFTNTSSGAANTAIVSEFERMKIAGNGNVSINALAGSGNRIAVVNSFGTFISAVIGSGLAFDGTTLTATGGSSGSISGSGTSGTIALFTGSTSIGNSVITQSGSNVTVNGEIRLIGPNILRFEGAGPNNAFISEAWGINLNGATTHPIQVRNASLSVGYALGSGTAYGTSNFFVQGNTMLGTLSDNGARFQVNGNSFFNADIFTYNNGGIFFSGFNTFTSGIFQNVNGLNLQTSGAPRLTISTGGAATFTSSVTATSFFESSDATLKTLVEDDYQAKGIDNVVAKLYIKNGKQELGYFAQDLQNILPSAVSKGSDGLLNLSYREVHTAKIAYLEEEIRQIKKRYEIN